MMSYKININDFEGPLDLLLFFIQRDKLNIYDIPISKITNDFLQYLSNLTDKDIEVGAEFIYMASLLMKIKSKMLLPTDEVEEELVDPRQDLVLKLLEYKKFKQISETISKIGDKYSQKHKTRINEKLINSVDIKDTVHVENVDLYELIKAFENIIRSIPENNYHEVINESHSIKDQMNLIEQKLSNKKKIPFKSLFKYDKSKSYIVYTFIALLEMIKNGIIKIEQKKSFNDIYLINNKN
tara:strand:+ start:5745 stop:6464 length:720 start_codon:yes stop_codon:yes gene_type:complete